MSISGRLDDIGVAEVMQFIHLGRRSGTLYIESDAQAQIDFFEGRIVAARGTNIQRLGELLVDRGVIPHQTLMSAVSLQRTEGRGRALGEVLLSLEALSPNDLTRAVEEQIQETIVSALTWTRGVFRFALNETRPIQGFERTPGEILPGVDLNTQMVLLEAARVLDEINRRGELEQNSSSERSESIADLKADSKTRREQPGAETVDDLFEDPVPAGEADETLDLLEDDGFDPTRSPVPRTLSIQLVSTDDVLAEQLADRLKDLSLRLDRRTLGSAGFAIPGEPTSLVLLDLRTIEVEELKRLHRRRPEAALIGLLGPDVSREEVIPLGAVATTGPKLDDVLSKLREVNDIRLRRMSLEEDSTGSRSAAIVNRLRSLSEEIRAGARSASATLVLLNTLAECTERAVLFLVRHDGLSAVGGFGTSLENGHAPIAQATKGLHIPTDEQSAFLGSLIDRRPSRIYLDHDQLPASLMDRIGKPRSGQAALFPVVGTNRVVLMIYTDNGSRETPLEEIDLLTLAADQVGLAIENEFLRSRLAAD